MRKITHVRAFGYKHFYQNETWCNANQGIHLADDEPTDLLKNTRWKGGLNALSGSGKRLIINHIGPEDGGCRERTARNECCSFERWWSCVALSNLPNKLVVVVDNAKYHSRQTEESRAQLQLGG